MKIFPFATCLLCFVLLFTSCQDAAEPSSSQSAGPFFNLTDYIEGQIFELNKEQPKVQKVISIDGQQEAKVLDSLDYRTELKTFLNSDINRKAWVDKYDVDSIFENSNLKQITYKANTEDLKTQLIHIRYEEDQVSEVYIENRTFSLVADVSQDLHYEAGIGYRLVTTQKTVLSDEQEIEVRVAWK
ncbi:MAG: hypothetical protein KI786_01520 [Mameliella sp.]|nr:hypothetical protein [Phaeodactylibacter sp.]